MPVALTYGVVVVQIDRKIYSASSINQMSYEARAVFVFGFKLIVSYVVFFYVLTLQILRVNTGQSRACIRSSPQVPSFVTTYKIFGRKLGEGDAFEPHTKIITL